MKVELIGRFADNSIRSEEEMEEERIQELINSEYKRKQSYTYKSLFLDLNNIDESIELDRYHTQLNMVNDRTYIIKLPYQHFVKLYEQFTLSMVMKVEMSEVEPKSNTIFSSLEND